MRLALAAFALGLAPQALAPGRGAGRTRRRGPRSSRRSPSARCCSMLAWAGTRMFAVGERGHILHSADAGSTWSQSPVPASANLTAVYFADAKHGWAVGHVEVILRTRGRRRFLAARALRAGQVRSPCSTSPSPTLSRGVAVGAYGVVYVTSDGGSVWSQVPFEPDAAARRRRESRPRRTRWRRTWTSASNST